MIQKLLKYIDRFKKQEGVRVIHTEVKLNNIYDKHDTSEIQERFTRLRDNPDFVMYMQHIEDELIINQNGLGRKQDPYKKKDIKNMEDYSLVSGRIEGFSVVLNDINHLISNNIKEKYVPGRTKDIIRDVSDMDGEDE